MTVTYIISLAIQLAVVIAVVVIVLLLARPGRSEDRDELELGLSRLHDDITSVRSAVVSSLSSQTGVVKSDLSEAVQQFSRAFPPGISDRLAQLELVLTGLSKRVLEIQQEVAHARKTEGDPNQELKRLLREEVQPLRHQLQDLEDNLPTQVRQVAGILEPTVTALEGKLGTRHQAAIDVTLLQLTSALNQTEARLTATARQQEVLVTEVRADLRDVRDRLAEFGALLQMLPERMRAGSASPLPAESRDSAIPLPDRVEPDPGTADSGFRSS